MAEPDELLARADDWLENTPAVVHAGTVQLVERLAAALRAALAAQPQPLFEGTMGDFIRRFDTLHQPAPHLLDHIVVYPAVAGPATSTGDDDE